jgi:hypothetical protein
VLGEASSEKVRVAFSAPRAEGVKVIVTTQLVPEATGVPATQVVEAGTMAKSVFPLSAGLLLKCSAAVPVLVFFTVTVIVVLVVPCETEPNASGLGGIGVSITTGIPEGIPVPERETFCVIGFALSVNTNTAVSILVEEGLNVTLTVHIPPATTGVPTAQPPAPPVVRVKSAGFVPMFAGMLMLVKLSGRFPEFIRVTVLGLLVTP